jgi:hypothetical protein
MKMFLGLRSPTRVTTQIIDDTESLIMTNKEYVGALKEKAKRTEETNDKSERREQKLIEQRTKSTSVVALTNLDSQPNLGVRQGGRVYTSPKLAKIVFSLYQSVCKCPQMSCAGRV